MHDALILIACTIALAHDHWRRTIGRRRPLSEKTDMLEEQLRRLRAENAPLRARWHRAPGKRRRRYGAVGRKRSICLIERFWRSMKQEYIRHLFLYRSTKAIEARLRRYQTWFNQERPHQGLGQRTADDVYFDRPCTPTRDITGGTLHVRFLDGDRRLPILRFRDAA